MVWIRPIWECKFIITVFNEIEKRPDNTEIKVDIESLRKDIENMNTINGRIDTVIDKLIDVSTSIKSMLMYTKKKNTAIRKDR